MTNDIVKVSSETTLQKLRRFSNAFQRLKQARAEINRLECELANAANDLGKWCVPEDAVKGEVFHVWIGDGILAASLRLNKDGEFGQDYAIAWRKPPSARVAAEMQLS